MGNTLPSKQVMVADMSLGKKDLQTALCNLRKKQTKDKCILSIERGDVLFPFAVSYLKESGRELCPIEVKFTIAGCEEDVVNAGGPNKEFFTLLFQSCLRKDLDMFERQGQYAIPIGNRFTLEGELYLLLGKTIVMSLSCGGPAFPNLAPYVVSYIRGHPYEHELDLSLIVNSNLRSYIKKISNASTQVDIDKTVGEDDENFMDHCGWPRPQLVTLDKKHHYIQVLLHWELVGKRKEALDQMKQGLNALGFLEMVKDIEDIGVLIATDSSPENTAMYVRECIVTGVRKLECKSKDEETAQKFTIMCMEDFTDEECCHLYQFITGLNFISHIDYKIEVEFNRTDRSAILPESSTCVHKLFIPLGNNSKLKFYSSFNVAIMRGRVGFAGKD